MVSFRCIDERHIPYEIQLMKWNPKMDLIVIAFNNGDIILYRLVSWQKVWHIPAPKIKHNTSNNHNNKNNIMKTNVIDLSWRPDGKIIAIAYEHNIDNKTDDKQQQSCVVLHDVETSDLIHIIPLDGKVTCICWEEKQIQKNDKQNDDENDDGNDDLGFISKDSLPPFIKLLPQVKFSSTKGFFKNYPTTRKINDENINDLMKVENQENLNVLTIGTDKGVIELYAMGVFKIAKINIENGLFISYISLTNDLGMINILVNDKPNKMSQDEDQEHNINYSIINYQLDILKEKSFQILIIAQIYAQTLSLLYYLDSTIREILETWEDVMVEIDSKLSDYGSLKQSRSSSDENSRTEQKVPLMADQFLELLVLGNASDSLEKFLTDLTEKGLKKLGHSIDLAYSNIQKLVIRNIQRVCQLLYCHINSLRGMALWETKFNGIGLDINSVNVSLKAIGSFLLKSTELQQVIDNSMRNVKAFIRWLYTSMTRLYNNEPSTQSELSKVSQQDIQFVAEFIKENFDVEPTTSEGTSTSQSRPSDSNFTLERVGQYFKDKNLSSIISSVNDLSTNPWINYLKERPQLISNDNNNHIYLYPHNFETSLIQEYKNCDKCVRETFTKPFNAISNSFEKNNIQTKLTNFISISPEQYVKIHHGTSLSQSYAYNAFIIKKTSNQLYIIRYSLDKLNEINIVGVIFYKSNYSSQQSSEFQILDLEFYTEDLISLLLSENETSLCYLVQFPIKMVQHSFKKWESHYENFPSHIDCVQVQLGSSFSDMVLNYRCLDNMKASILAVSGSRKVACVAFASMRRVRLFEMDVCEDDEEETISEQQNTSTEQQNTSTEQELFFSTEMEVENNVN